MNSIFLHGGGGHPDALHATFGAFAASAGSKIAFVLVGKDAERDFPEYRALFEHVGAGEVTGIFLAPHEILTPERLNAAQPTGVFVGGGETPLYHNALCRDLSWLEYLRQQDIAYGGTSAGAMIASERAVVGGWQINDGDKSRQILFEGAGENLNLIEVRQGLGLVPFSIDAHASQWGTLTRLIHAINGGFTEAGWAIDEDTMLIVERDRIIVRGIGQAYRVRRTDDGVQVTIYPGGSQTSL